MFDFSVYYNVPSVLWYCWLGLLTCKNRIPYNLYCVGEDVKHCSINQSIQPESEFRRLIRHTSVVRAIPLYVAAPATGRDATPSLTDYWPTVRPAPPTDRLTDGRTGGTRCVEASKKHRAQASDPASVCLRVSPINQRYWKTLDGNVRRIATNSSRQHTAATAAAAVWLRVNTGWRQSILLLWINSNQHDDWLTRTRYDFTGLYVYNILLIYKIYT